MIPIEKNWFGGGTMQVRGCVLVTMIALFWPALSQAAVQVDNLASEAAKLVTSLRKPGITINERQQIADRLLSLGDEGPRQLVRYAGPEVEKKTIAYLSALEKAVTNVLRERVKANGGAQKFEAEVEAQRQKSLGVSRSKTITKEAIQEKCDPAIARLTELLQVAPEQAADARPELKSQREEAMQLATLYHAAAEKTPSEKKSSIPSIEEIQATLEAQEKLVCLMAIPMRPQDKETLKANVPIAAKMDLAEALGIAELNRLRLLLGIGALKIDPKLCDASRDHSKDMKRLNFFDHDSPVPGKETPWKRAAKFGTRATMENIYEGSVRGETAIRVWWYSPGHHANMMGGAMRVGLGREEKYFTQMFGSRE